MSYTVSSKSVDRGDSWSIVDSREVGNEYDIIVWKVTDSRESKK